MINTTSEIGKTRRLVVTAMLAAVSTVLMFIDFSVPFMPAFIKMDVSELPALIASFSMGPLSGTAVCFIKNLINLTRTSTGGVGELANFMHGVFFVVPAGIMAVLSVPINYFITYPIYSKFMPIDAIIGMYQAIIPSVNGLLQCLIVFNMPFTFIKGIIDSVLAFLIYKRISHIIKGHH